MREIVSPPLLARGTRPRRRPLRAAASAVAEPFAAVYQACRDDRFIYYAIFAFTIAFAMAFGGPFYFRNALNSARLTKLWTNVIFMVFSPLSALGMIWLWGRLIDRWGRRPVMMLALMGAFFSPVGWLVITPGMPMWGAILIGAATCMIGGTMWSGVELARFNVLLGFSDGSGRSKYIAAAAVFTAAGGFLGGWLGGWLADWLIDLQFDRAPLHVGPFRWNNWHVTFLVSMLARALAFLWLVRMPDPGAKRFRDVIRHIRVNLYNNALPWLSWRRPLWRRRRNGAPPPPEGDRPP